MVSTTESTSKVRVVRGFGKGNNWARKWSCKATS
jgi:hypothetical protein